MNHEDKIFGTGARKQRSCKTCRIGSVISEAQGFLQLQVDCVASLFAAHASEIFRTMHHSFDQSIKPQWP